MLNNFQVSQKLTLHSINALYHHALLCKRWRLGKGETQMPSGIKYVLFQFSLAAEFQTLTYPNAGGCNLEVVQPAQGALSVCKVGGSQLVEGFQSHCACRIRVLDAALAP